VNGRNIMPGTKFFQMTPLIMNATQKDDCSEVTAMLIEAGADVHAVDANGKTALAHAQERGLTRIEEVLLRSGAA
jgi:ankyrin repeat protein